MSTNMVGKVRRARKIDPNGNIYYDRGVSDIIFDPIRGTSVKEDIDNLMKGMKTALEYVAANPKGLDGLSAYEIAKEHGFEGTEYEWVQSLKGVPGDDGLSAYELACVYNGFEGNVFDYLASLKGEKGDRGYSTFEIAVQNGYTGTEEEWIDSMTLSYISDQTIIDIYDRLTKGDHGDGSNYEELIETINALNQKVETMDDALQDTVSDIGIESNSITGVKTNGEEFSDTMFDIATNDDIDEALSKMVDKEEE